MAIKVAINGFGRIGRSFFRVASERDDIDIVAINDLGDPENLIYLLKYDTAQGKTDIDIRLKEGNIPKLVADGHESSFYSIREPKELISFSKNNCLWTYCSVIKLITWCTIF